MSPTGPPMAAPSAACPTVLPMMAPVPAPTRTPRPAPLSLVVTGPPAQPTAVRSRAELKTAEKDSARLFAERLRMHTHGGLILALLFEPLELSLLAVKLSLVRVGLTLLFGLFLFLSLHLVTDQGAGS